MQVRSFSFFERRHSKLFTEIIHYAYNTFESVHMNGLNYLSGFCLSPKILEEYIANKQYQKSPYINNEGNVNIIPSIR
jgi:hypothetical protein